MAARVVCKEEDKEYLNHVCGECALCEPYMKWETLTVKDRKPTMGTCPHKEFKVLLSERACKEHFKLKRLVL